MAHLEMIGLFLFLQPGMFLRGSDVKTSPVTIMKGATFIISRGF